MKFLKWDIKKIWNFKKGDQEGSLRKNAFKGIVLFLILITVFTVLSRAADSMTIPKVKAELPSKKNLEFSVSATGQIVQNQDQAISVLENLKIESIYVNEGQKVSAGENLFQLNMEDLESKKIILENALGKLEMALKELESKDKVEKNDSAIALKRANENYSLTSSKVGTEIANAYNAMIRSQNKLADFQNTASGTDEGAAQVLQVLQNTITEKEAALENANASLESTKGEIDRLVTQRQTEEQQKLKAANAAAGSAETGQTAGTATSTSLTVEELASIEAAVRAENQYRLDEATAAIAAAEVQSYEAQTALSNQQNSSADSLGQTRKEQEETLLSDFESKKEMYETAVQASNLTVAEVENAIEDAKKEKVVSTSAEQAQLEIDAKKVEMEKVTALIEKGGTITTPIEGVVTKNFIKVGDVTPNSAAMLLADIKSGSKFVAQLTSEQQKYIARNDKVTLKTADGKKVVENLNVDLLSNSAGGSSAGGSGAGGSNAEGSSVGGFGAGDSGLTEITILLPKGELEIGTTATLEFTKTSATYNSCVPIQAIRTDSYGKSYIFTMKETETVLGTELQVVRRDVQIQEKSEKFAALAEGSLTSTDKVITSSSKTLNAGDRVRLEEE